MEWNRWRWEEGKHWDVLLSSSGGEFLKYTQNGAVEIILLCS